MNRLPRVPGFLGLAALALPVAAPALAQQEAGGLEEVVVTAERREANLQETPVTLTALTGEQVADQGITTTQDIAKTVPTCSCCRSPPAPRRSRSGCAAASSRPAA